MADFVPIPKASEKAIIQNQSSRETSVLFLPSCEQTWSCRKKMYEMKFHCPSKGPEADSLQQGLKNSKGLQRGMKESMNMDAKVLETIPG